MQLMTEELRNQLPKLYETENQGESAMVYAHYFHSISNWHWYVLEFDGKDIFFGLVIGFEMEYGYYSLTELEQIGKDGDHVPPLERDLLWEKQPVRQVKRAWQQAREGA